MELSKLVRKNILSLSPYSSARDEYTGEAALLLDANESPFPSQVNRYPDPYQVAVKEQISRLKGLAIDQVFLGNGSDEAIDLIMRIFCIPGSDNIVVCEPTYGMYEVSAGINDITVKKVPLSPTFQLQETALKQAIDPRTKVIFFCSPNNPTGNMLDREVIKTITKSFNGIIVVDEAYIDFSESESFINALKEFPNLIVLQTLSKAWGMAGVRLGMAFAHPSIIRLLNKVKPPYNINALTQQFVTESLKNSESIIDQAHHIIAERERLATALRDSTVVQKVFPSSGNFLLARFTDCQKVYQTLIERHIVVRDRSSQLYCENCLRITVGTQKENDQLLLALNTL